MAVRKTGAQKARKTAKKPPRKTSSRGRQGRSRLSMIILLFAIIALISAFFVLLPKVRNSVSAPPRQTGADQSPPVQTPPTQTETPTAPEGPAGQPRAQSPATETPPPQSGQQEQAPVIAEPSPEPVPTQTPQEQTEQPPAPSPSASTERPGDIRDRDIYFMQTARGGDELRLTKAGRRIRVSDSPLLDCIGALLAGPTAEEEGRGLQNFIPPDTRIISAMIRGSTAYLNFSEEFQYNTFGREGCAAQIRQIVWTATEFPSVSDVQFLIEGKRVDFLTEGVMIGGPIGR
ncbi:MAG: GerMN domain-containing protein [Treponema sp.]|nr:GerMN domain-containing protein [Treponema sp.]